MRYPEAVPGLISVAGGKYTTYRVMAEDAVDMVAANLDGKVPAAVTAETPLVGADGYRALWNQRDELAAESGLHTARIEHLLGRYGSLVLEILDLIRLVPNWASRWSGRTTTWLPRFSTPHHMRGHCTSTMP